MTSKLGALCLAAAALAQATPGGQRPPAFRAETRLVVLNVAVTNARGELVTGLTQNAFRVFENGKPQSIALFRNDDVPVSLGLLIDNSGSMRRLRAKVETAALAFARASNPGDEIFVVNFADTPRVDVPFTSDVRVLEAGIARVDSIGGTAMRDAVDLAAGYLRDHATRDRKVLVVVTDGIDNESQVPADRIEREAEAGGVVVDAIGLFAEGEASEAKTGRRELDRLVERTGGVAYYPASLDQIGAVSLDLARQIRSQYTIAYAPTNQALDGTYRAIRVTAAGARGLRARTRPGYLAR